MQFCDRLSIGQPRRTREGYLAVRARAARTGVYQYDGRQVDPDNKHGLRDEATVNVLRDEATVFDEKAVRTFVGKPITVDHPHQAVTAANWKDHSRGAIMGALRDGDYVAFDLLLMDAGAIEAIDAGKKELSNGYAAELEFGDFTAPDGTKCPVRQSRISDGNHVALVDAGRAGAECRISDGGNKLFETCDAAPIIFDGSITLESSTMPHTLTIDGLQVPNVSDEAKAAIEKLQGQVSTLTAARDTAVEERDAARKEVETKDGEIVVLKKQVEDANDPTKQAARDAARAKVIAGAQALKPGITVDGRTDAAIRKEAVEAHLGDAAKDLSDDAIVGAFAAATKDVKPVTDKVVPLVPTQNNVDGAAVRNAVRDTRYA